MRNVAILIFLGFPVAAQAAGVDAFDFGTSAQTGVSSWRPAAEINLRSDTVRDLPRPAEADFERWEARAWLGGEWQANESVFFRGTVRAFTSDQDNDRIAFNLDNERLHDVAIDELFVDWRGAQGNVRLGQMPMPLRVSAMTWDPDLRVRGVQARGAFGDFDHEIRITGIGGEIDHPLGSGARLAGLQWQSRLSGVTYVSLAGLVFDDLDGLPQAFRTNSRSTTSSALANEFRLLEAHLAHAWLPGDRRVQLGLHLVHNLEADAGSDGGRFELRYSGADVDGGEIGAAIQRIQADAVPAGFNDDDWWFPTRMRGHVVWTGWTFNSGWRLRVAGFREKRDGMPEWMSRTVIDLSWRY